MDFFQVRSKSLNHLDEIEMRQPTPDPSAESALKDSKSEPDCAQTLITPSTKIGGAKESSASATDVNMEAPVKRHMLSRSQVSAYLFILIFENFNNRKNCKLVKRPVNERFVASTTFLPYKKIVNKLIDTRTYFRLWIN